MSSTINIFIAYSRKDTEYLDELRTHFTPLERSGKVTIWYDGKIEPGALWETAIKKRLHSADIVLLLVSASAIASDYFYDEEMKDALERHRLGTTKVVPFILRPCTWQATPLAKLQVIPQDGKPASTWNDRDEAYSDAVNRLWEMVNTMQISRSEEANTKSKAKEEQRLKEEAEIKRKAEEEERLRAEAIREEEQNRKEEAETKRKAEEEQRLKEETEIKRKAEEEQKKKVEAKRKAEEEQRLKEEAEAKSKVEETQRLEEEAKAKRKIEEEQRVEEEAESLEIKNSTLGKTDQKRRIMKSKTFFLIALIGSLISVALFLSYRLKVAFWGYEWAVFMDIVIALTFSLAMIEIGRLKKSSVLRYFAIAYFALYLLISILKMIQFLDI